MRPAVTLEHSAAASASARSRTAITGYSGDRGVGMRGWIPAWAIDSADRRARRHRRPLAVRRLARRSPPAPKILGQRRSQRAAQPLQEDVVSEPFGGRRLLRDGTTEDPLFDVRVVGHLRKSELFSIAIQTLGADRVGISREQWSVDSIR